MLLRVDETTVIGGYYPEIVFFPARDRSGWSRHARLRHMWRPRLSHGH